MKKCNRLIKLIMLFSILISNTLVTTNSISFYMVSPSDDGGTCTVVRDNIVHKSGTHSVSGSGKRNFIEFTHSGVEKYVISLNIHNARIEVVDTNGCLIMSSVHPCVNSYVYQDNYIIITDTYRDDILIEYYGQNSSSTCSINYIRIY